jgi:hypothetical protein
MAFTEKGEESSLSRHVKSLSIAICLTGFLGGTTLLISALEEVSFDRTELWLGQQSELSRTGQIGPAVPASTAEPPAVQTEVVPTLVIDPENKDMWANGGDEASIRILLRAVRGNQSWPFINHGNLVFNIEPITASFVPSKITVEKGKDRSQNFAKLTAQQPSEIEVACIPGERYEGLAIRRADSKKVRFIAPINRVGIDPVSRDVQVNSASPFEVYLYNDKDSSKSRLAPADPVYVELHSENGNGKVSETVIELNKQRFTRLVDYIGEKTGMDNIIASADYAGLHLKSEAARVITFPWRYFLVGILGAFCGALLRGLLSPKGKRFRRFLASLVFGLVFCVILISIRAGALPSMSNIIHPVVMFFLTLAASYLGSTPVLGLLRILQSLRGGESNAED